MADGEYQRWVSFRIDFTRGPDIGRADAELEEAGFDIFAEYAEWEEEDLELPENERRPPVIVDGHVVADIAYIDVSLKVAAHARPSDFRTIETRINDIITKYGGAIKQVELIGSGVPGERRN